jgi:hypothetical protein
MATMRAADALSGREATPSKLTSNSRHDPGSNPSQEMITSPPSTPAAGSTFAIVG